MSQVSTLDKNNNKFILLSYYTESKAAEECQKTIVEKFSLDSKYKDSLTAKAYIHKKSFIVNDTFSDDSYKIYRDYALRVGYKAKAAFPIVYKSKIYGVLTLYATEKDCFDNTLTKTIATIVASIAFTIYKLELERGQELLLENLERSEAKFNLILENTNEGIWEYNAQEDELTLSKQCDNIIECLDKKLNIHRGNDFVKLIHKDDLDNYKKTLVNYYKNKTPIFEVTVRIKTRNNDYKWVLIRGIGIEENKEGIITRLGGIIADITDIVKTNERLQKLNNFYRTLSEINQLIVKAENREDIENELCEIVVKNSAISMSWYGIYDENIEDLIIKANYSSSPEGIEYIKNLHISIKEDSPYGKGATGIAYRKRIPVIIENVAENPSLKPWLNILKKANFVSFVVLPIIYKTDIYGLLALYADRQSYFDDELVSLLKEMALDIGFAFHRIELNNIVRLSEERWRIALDVSNEIVAVFDYNENKVTCSPKFYELLGYDKNLYVTDDNLFSLLHSEDKENIGRKRAALIDGQIDSFSGENRLKCSDGHFKWFYHHIKTLEKNDNGTAKTALGAFLDIDGLKKREFEIKKINNFYKTLSKTNQLISRGKNIKELFNELCQIIIEQLDITSALIVKINHKRKVHYVLSMKGINESISTLSRDIALTTDCEKQSTLICRSAINKVFQVSNNLLDDDFLKCWQAGFVKTGLKSMGIFPIVIDNRIYAFLQISSNKINFFNDEIINLLNELCNDLSYAWQKITTDKLKIKFEKNLKASEERWRYALESSNEGVFDMDLKTRTTIRTNKFLEMLEFSGKELNNSFESFFNLIHPDDKKEFNDKFDNLLSGKASHFYMEIRVKCKSGVYKWILSRAIIIKYSTTGEPLRVIGTHLDIDDLKKHQFKIEKITNIYKILSRINQLLVKESNIKKLYFNTCKTIVEYLNLPFAAFVRPHTKSGKLLTISSFARNEEIDKFIKNVSSSINADEKEGKGVAGQAYRNKKCFVVNNLYEDSDMQLWINELKRVHLKSAAALPVFNKGKIIAVLVIDSYQENFFDDDIVELLNDLSGDISFAFDKIVSEKEKQKLARALMDSEKRWRAASENTDEGVWLHYMNTGKVFYSRKWKEMLGFSEDEIGTGLNEFWNRIHPDDREKHIQIINGCKEGKTKNIESTIRLKTKSGDYKWILVRGSIYHRDSSGKAISLIGTHIDIAEIKESNEKLQQLNYLYEALILSNSLLQSEENLENIYKGICKIAVKYGNITLASVLEPDIDRHTFNKVASYAEDKNILDNFLEINLSTDATNKFCTGTIGTSFREKRFAIVDNTLNDEKMTPWLDILKKINIASVASFPVMYNNEVCAILVLLAKEPSFFDNRIIELIYHLVNNLAISIRRIREAAIKKAYEKQLNIAFEAFNNINESIIITNIEGRIITVNKSFEILTGYSPKEALTKTQDIFNSEKHSKEFYKNIQWSLSKLGFWQGEYYIRKKDGEVIPTWMSTTAVKDSSGEVLNYISVITNLTQKKEIEDKIIYLSNYDALTGLPNRTLFSDRLEQSIALAKRLNKRFAIIYIDIDRFKTINDNLGHNVGDILLQQFSQRLKSTIRGSDTVSRSSADEFYIIINDLTEIDDITTVIKKTFDNISEPFDVNGYKINITASIGITIFPDDGSTLSTLMRNAETALYYAKETGRNTYQFYKTDMTVKSRYTFELKNRLKQALEDKEFVLYYQPKLSLKTGQIIGAEALIRWQHPEKGLIPPLDFIYIAESSGMIKQIGEWVIEETCRQIKEWKRKALPEISISVNVSAIQFQDRNLKNIIEISLKKSCINPSQVELELTESIIMKDTESSLQILNILKDMNLLLSIDDFGTGYSSLAYLKKFPIDKIKIDRSFISHLTEKKTDDAAIVKTIISLAKTLGLSVIAEGVETKDQLDLLANWECDEYQGYYFSRPVPAKEFEALFRKNISQNKIIS